ncbi:MAG: sugar ABC transporter permease, partial [Anaerolineae bacterium]|nr:sugar ABC transporter permease [Anaerolineae bacterium]
FSLVMNTLGLILEPLQNRIGVQRMAYIFLLPNLLIFGIFVLFPMALNFYYAFTTGTALFPQDRTFSGAQNYQLLFDCDNFLD